LGLAATMVGIGRVMTFLSSSSSFATCFERSVVRVYIPNHLAIIEPTVCRAMVYIAREVTSGFEAISSTVDTRPEHAFRTRNVSAANSTLRSPLTSLPACHGKGFERALRSVMVVVSVHALDVESDA